MRWIETLDQVPPGEAPPGPIAWIVSPAARPPPLPAPRPEDLAHAARRRDPARRAATLDRRLRLRALAARLLGTDASAVGAAQPPRGGAEIVAPRPLHAALAARGGWSLIVVSPGPVGADVERVEPGAHRPLDLLHPDLAARLAGADDAAFAEAWADAEAYLKRLGVGLEGLGEVRVAGSRAFWSAGGRPAARLSRRRLGAHVFVVAS